jgi:AcrR family transcriptional regulator
MAHQIGAPDGSPSPVPDTHDRIIDAALRCFARVGLSKTTLDDVAREAGCARATLYRYFPGKQPLAAAVVAREAGRLGAMLRRATDDCTSLEDAIVAATLVAVRELSQHDALQHVLLVEPDVLQPHLAFHHAEAFLRDASALVAPVFTPYLPPDRAERAAEWCTRIVLSYVCSPSPDVDLFDAASVRRLVGEFVVPGFTRSSQGVTS